MTDNADARIAHSQFRQKFHSQETQDTERDQTGGRVIADVFGCPAERGIEKIQQKNDERSADERVRSVSGEDQQETDGFLSRALVKSKDFPDFKPFLTAPLRTRRRNVVLLVGDDGSVPVMVRLEKEDHHENGKDLQEQCSPKEICKSLPGDVITDDERSDGRDHHGDGPEENETRRSVAFDGVLRNEQIENEIYVKEKEGKRGGNQSSLLRMLSEPDRPTTNAAMYHQYSGKCK